MTLGRHRRFEGRFRFIIRRRRNSRYPVMANRRWYNVLDHCNHGLILLSGDHMGPDKCMYLCNPATRQWTRMPPPCPRSFSGRTFIVFDLASMSPPCYKVLWTQREPENPKGNQVMRRYLAGKDLGGADDAKSTEAELEEEFSSWRLTEWPPLQWSWHEFSSTTSRWVQRVLVREGEAAGTLGDLILRKWDYVFHPRWRYAAYWQGALYVHCRGEYVSRLSLGENRYQVIKSPIDLDTCSKSVKSFIGKSEKGVYFGTIDACQLHVWILDESHGQMQWVLMHHSGLKPDAWEEENC
ncbi:unnamed protein product [Urochloa humidicola]